MKLRQVIVKNAAAILELSLAVTLATLMLLVADFSSAPPGAYCLAILVVAIVATRDMREKGLLRGTALKWALLRPGDEVRIRDLQRTPHDIIATIVAAHPGGEVDLTIEGKPVTGKLPAATFLVAQDLVGNQLFINAGYVIGVEPAKGEDDE